MIKQVLAHVAVFALVGLPFACGGRAKSPPPSHCQAVAWGGWDGIPACAGIASIVIAPEYRSCRGDNDCSLVGVTRCSAHAVNRTGAAALAEQPPPCTLPGLGHLCQPAQFVPRCQEGCCVPARN